MGDEGAGEPFVGIVDGGATEYEGILPSDTISLSDSDSEDLEFLGNAEVDSVSPEELCPSDDVDYESSKIGDSSHISQKSFVQPFHLKGMSSGFFQRSQNIFDCLEGAAKQALPSMSDDSVVDGRFKRPRTPPSILNKMPAESSGRQLKPIKSYKSSPAVPDYVTHPERWTKYSLEDVSECNDDANRSIAMEFLSGLKKDRKEQSATCSEDYTPSFNQDASSSGAGRIVFTRPTKTGLDRSERKREAEKEEKEKEEATTENQDVKRKALCNFDAQNKEDMVALDSSEALEENVATTMGFHGSKKRSRKHFRPKASQDEEEEDS